MTVFEHFALAKQSRNQKNRKKPASRNISWFRIILGAGTILILSFLLSLHLLPDRVTLQVGDIAPKDIRAHRTVRYVDSQLTEELRREAALHADKKYRDVPNAAADAVTNINSVFDLIERARENKSLKTVSAKVQYVVSNLRFDISRRTLETLIEADSATFNQIRLYIVQPIRDIMSRPIPDDTNDVQLYRQKFKQRMEYYLGHGRYASAAAEIGSMFIRPNRIFDPEATEKERRHQAESVPPQYRQITSGDLIIAKGQQVTPTHLDQFTALGLRHPVPDYVTILCIAILVTFVYFIIAAYTKRFFQSVYASDKMVLLLSLVVVVSVFALRLVGSMLKLQLSGVEYSYFAMVWISSAGMLIASLINPQLAVLIVCVLATTSGIAMNYELQWGLSALLSSLVAIYAVSDIRNRFDMVPVFIEVCLANLAVVWLIGRISGDSVQALLNGSAWALAGGVGTIMLFWFGAIALEKPFGITTHSRLVELADTNHPILRRLLMEAPGTYSHSIYVGDIAAAAADQIGVDSLLVRVAAYYHDIGKIRRPNFFVENQHVENIHDRLNPSLSAIIIRSHIKDGLDLAKEYHLPLMIRELMEQHHGTSLVRYFYYQAAVGASGETSMLEQQFRYDGTKPQTKESAILMLADACEAASRSLSRPTPGQIEDMVTSIINEKLSDGQLDESDLTFRDISTIKETFVRTLVSMMHARIEYPDLSALEAKKQSGNGNPDKERTSEGGKPAKNGKSGIEVPSV